MVGDPVCTFNEFSSYGYTAGMVLKGRWKGQDEIYNHIKKEFLGDTTRMIAPFQTHSPDIAVIEKDHTPRNLSVDGAISDLENICLTVRSADCIPLLMIDTSTGFFGAVHIGWRGFAGGIVEELFDLVDSCRLSPGDMHFHLGPSIGDCCYEVGDEVAMLFDDRFVTRRDNKFFVDLLGALTNRLMAAGVRKSNIGVSPDCTSCLSNRYYSYRRDGEASIQMVSFIFRCR